MAQAQTKVKGEAGRVIILDVSGSMVGRSYTANRPRDRRLDVGKDVLIEYLAELTRKGDKTKTAVMLFGAKLSWKEAQAAARGRFTSPSDYPPSGPLCSDISVSVEFGVPSKALESSSAKAIQAIQPSGMTPIPNAIKKALSLLDPEFGGEIVLISDLDKPNCLLPGQTFCEAIAEQLVLFGGGVSLRIEAKVVEVPGSNAQDQMSPCIPTSRFPVPQTNANPVPIVEQLFTAKPIQTVLVFSQQVDVAADRSLGQGATVTIKDASGDEIAAGPPGPMQIVPGRYWFTANKGGAQWARQQSVSDGSIVQIPVPPAELTVTAEDQNGRIRRLDSLSLRRPGGNALRTWSALSLPISITVPDGEFEVTGRANSVAASPVIVTTNLGRSSSATLRFDANHALRSVSVELSRSPTTLYPNQRSSADVVMVAPDGSRTAIKDGNSGLSLVPGQYRFEVQSAPPHLISVEIPAGQGSHAILIEVPPGRFVAEPKEPGGLFELRDATGTALFSFDGERVEHSLPDGDYELVYRTSKGVLSNQRFRIVTGDVVTLSF